MKILIADGGSKHSRLAVQVGVVFARAARGSIAILHVSKDRERITEAEAIIERAVALADQAGAKADSIEKRIRFGHPAEEIVSEALEGQYNLIVVGTWPKQNLMSRLLAPTTERIVMQAPCPVLVAKEEIRSIDHVLLCVSGAESPSRATRFLTETAAEMLQGLQITVLHVMSQISTGLAHRDDWQLVASAERLIQENTPEGQWLKHELDALARLGARIQPKVRHGLVVDEVLKEEQDSRCNLVVIGAHRRAGWQRFLLDDLTHELVIGVEGPVLIV